MIGLTMLRFVRLIRIVRLLRFAKNIGMMRNFLSMLYHLNSALASFVPAVCLLLTVIYFFAILFMQGVENYVHDSRSVHRVLPAATSTLAELQEHFGSVRSTSWTLLAAISGGDDWVNFADPLAETGAFNQVLFVFFIVFVLFGLLSVVQGVLVDVAMRSCEMARENAIETALARKDKLVNDIVSALMEADTDQSLTLSLAELRNYLSDEKVQAYFNSLDIDVRSAEKIFALLDVDDSKELSIVDFVAGCLDYRGVAKVVDVEASKRLSSEMVESLGRIEGILCEQRAAALSLPSRISQPV